MTSPKAVEPTSRTQLRRSPDRGRFDRASIDAILDEAKICHLGFVDGDGQPFVLPTIHARIDDMLYVHGSAASRMMRHLATGEAICCTVTLLDGLVVARSAFHHSMNYRSVAVLGHARLVADPVEKAAALDAIVEHVISGRIEEVRAHTDKEFAATKVLALPIEEASAKVRTGGPNDEPEDLESGVWAGVIPRRDAWLPPVPSADLEAGVAVPTSVTNVTNGVRPHP